MSRSIILRSKKPDWMKRRLTSVGLAINNIVDISNCDAELGHPLHIFDRENKRK